MNLSRMKYSKEEKFARITMCRCAFCVYVCVGVYVCVYKVNVALTAALTNSHSIDKPRYTFSCHDDPRLKIKQTTKVRALREKKPKTYKCTNAERIIKKKNSHMYNTSPNVYVCMPK